WTDSAMFSQDPLSGVYSGITPWANNQFTIDQLRLTGQIVQIRIKRSGGKGERGSWPSQVGHRADSGSSESSIGLSGTSARSCSTSFCSSHGCNTTFGALGTP